MKYLLLVFSSLLIVNVAQAMQGQASDGDLAERVFKLEQIVRKQNELLKIIIKNMSDGNDQRLQSLQQAREALAKEHIEIKKVSQGT